MAIEVVVITNEGGTVKDAVGNKGDVWLMFWKLKILGCLRCISLVWVLNFHVTIWINTDIDVQLLGFDLDHSFGVILGEKTIKDTDSL